MAKNTASDTDVFVIPMHATLPIEEFAACLALPSFDRPANKYACGQTHGKRRPNR